MLFRSSGTCKGSLRLGPPWFPSFPLSSKGFDHESLPTSNGERSETLKVAETGLEKGLVLGPRVYWESYFLGTRITIHAGVFVGKKSSSLVRILIRFWFKYSL